MRSDALHLFILKDKYITFYIYILYKNSRKHDHNHRVVRNTFFFSMQDFQIDIV